MVVTVLLSGIPYGVYLEDLARALDQCLKSDEVGSFVARDLPHHRTKNGRRMVALDFQTGFDAMIAQDILNGFEYALPDQKYVLSAKVTNDRMYIPDNSMVEQLVTPPPPPIYSEALVAYTSRREEIERSHEALNDEIETLQKKLLIVKKKTKLIKAEKKLKKAKKARRRPSHPDSSDSEPRRKRRRGLRGTNSPPSPQPSTSTGKKRDTGYKKLSKSRSSDSSPSSGGDNTRERHRRSDKREKSCGFTSRRRSLILSTSRRSPLRSSPGYRLRRSPSGFRSKRSKRSPSPGLRSKRTPSPDLRSRRTPSPGNRSKRSPSPGLRSKRTPSPDLRSRRTPSPGNRSKRSPSPGLRSKRTPSPDLRSRRTPSPGNRSKRSPSPGHRSRQTPSPTYRSKQSPSPGLRAKRTPSPIYRLKRLPPPRHRAKRTPSPDVHSKWSPSPGYRESSPCSPIYRRRSPPSYHSRQSPYDRQRPHSERSSISPLRSRAEQPPSSNPGIVIVDRSTSALRPPHATITEIHEDNDLWGEVDQLVEVLESEKVAENSEPEQLEDEAEGNDPSAAEDRPKINVTINVVKKNATDLNKDLERDKRYLDKIKEEIQKCKSPKKQIMHVVGQVNKDLVLDKDLNPEELKKVMPKPLLEDVKIKEELDIEKEKPEDDDVKVIKKGRAISLNPKFVIVIKKILKEMRVHTARVDADATRKFFGVLRKILRMRFKELLQGKGYMNWRNILELYRQNYDTEQDGELVASVVNAMLDGAYADFVPSDDEDYDSGREDEHLFLPYIAGKKKKKKVTNNKENIPNQNDDEVVILEERAEVIAITDSEDDDCTIVKGPDDASAVITTAHVQCKIDPKSEGSDNASKLPKTVDMKCKEEKDLNYAGGVPLSGNINIVKSENVVDNLRVKVELPSSEDIINLGDENDIVKTEIDECDVKSEASTVELNDIATYGDELSNSVMSETNTDCHETNTPTGKESGNCLQSVTIKSEPIREDLIDDILKLTETKLTKTFTKHSQKGSTESMQTMKEISKGSICEVESETDWTKDSSQVMVVKPEKTVEYIENFVYNSSAERDDLVLDSDGNVKQDTKVANNKPNVQNQLQVLPNSSVKTEPEESVETIGDFVNQATTVVDETNLDSDDDVNQDAEVTNHKPRKQGVPNNSVKTERPEEESVESIEKFLDLVLNVNVID